MLVVPSFWNTVFGDSETKQQPPQPYFSSWLSHMSQLFSLLCWLLPYMITKRWLVLIDCPWTPSPLYLHFLPGNLIQLWPSLSADSRLMLLPKLISSWMSIQGISRPTWPSQNNWLSPILQNSLFHISFPPTLRAPKLKVLLFPLHNQIPIQK